MYYIKCTKRALSKNLCTQNNIVPLPSKDMAAGVKEYTVDVNRNNKILEGNEPNVTKDIQKADGSLVKELSAGTGDTITYVLTSTITATTENKYASYIIGDDMDSNLDASKVEIKSVSLVDGSNNKTALAYDKIDAPTSNKGLNYDFGISIKDTELAKDAFYGTGNKVEVIFTTQLIANPTRLAPLSPTPTA